MLSHQGYKSLFRYHFWRRNVNSTSVKTRSILTDRRPIKRQYINWQYFTCNNLYVLITNNIRTIHNNVLALLITGAMHVKYGDGRVSMMGARSISGKMSYIKMSWTLEATRLELYGFSITSSTIFGTESMVKSECQFPESYLSFLIWIRYNGLVWAYSTWYSTI